MENVNRSRGSRRDRHGRGVRRPLWSPRFEPGVARIGNFESTVQDAAEYLRTEYPDVFSELRVLVRDLPPLHGEIKSMRTSSAARGRGVGTRLLQHVVDESRQRGYRQLELETGTQEFFDPARRLYAKFGFVPCPPFGNYREDPNSAFFVLTL